MIDTTRILHVACLPFPTSQGTQAAVASMANASARKAETHLLTYGYGDEGTGYAGTVHLHRIRNVPKLSTLRSGPSWGKVAQDVQMAFHLRRLYTSLKPTLLLAHHIEAAWAASMARLPYVYVAHTALGPELPAYVPSFAKLPATILSRVTERSLCTNATIVAAISPWLKSYLADQTCRPVFHLPIPWVAPLPISERQRLEARRELALDSNSFVVGYTGNLDAYQGWQDVIEAVERLALSISNVSLIVATQSNATEVPQPKGIDRRIAPLRTEKDRRRVHAACDAIVVPRRIPGGLPIKLLDALSRGVPVVTTQRAMSGLALGDACLQTQDDTPEAIAHGLKTFANDPAMAEEIGKAGRAYVLRDHSEDRFNQALSELGSNPARSPTEKPTSKSTYAQAGRLLDPSL